MTTCKFTSWTCNYILHVLLLPRTSYKPNRKSNSNTLIASVYSSISPKQSCMYCIFVCTSITIELHWIAYRMPSRGNVGLSPSSFQVHSIRSLSYAISGRMLPWSLIMCNKMWKKKQKPWCWSLLLNSHEAEVQMVCWRGWSKQAQEGPNTAMAWWGREILVTCASEKHTIVNCITAVYINLYFHKRVAAMVERSTYDNNRARESTTTTSKYNPQNAVITKYWVMTTITLDKKTNLWIWCSEVHAVSM